MDTNEFRVKGEETGTRSCEELAIFLTQVSWHCHLQTISSTLVSWHSHLQTIFLYTGILVLSSTDNFLYTGILEQSSTDNFPLHRYPGTVSYRQFPLHRYPGTALRMSICHYFRNKSTKWLIPSTCFLDPSDAGKYDSIKKRFLKL